MKLLTFKEKNFATKHKSYGDKEFYDFLCIENPKDVEAFVAVNALIKSKQAIGFWMSFKTQDFYNSPVDYSVHMERYNRMGGLLATKMELSTEPTSIAKYCDMSDKIITDMNVSIAKYVIGGRAVRINEVGGYCPIDKDYSEYERVIDINEQEMYNFLLHKDISFKFEINKPTIAIENDSYIPKTTIETFCNITGNDFENVQVFTSFKHRSILFKKEDYFRFFNDGINNGLKNIVFETTSQDISQINSMKAVLEAVLEANPRKQLNLYAKVYDRHRKLYKTKHPNLTITFLER